MNATHHAATLDHSRPLPTPVPPGAKERYMELWRQTFSIGGAGLADSALIELKTYFPEMTSEQVEDTFAHSVELFNDHWHKSGVDVHSQAALDGFYNASPIEIFQLMHVNNVDAQQYPLGYEFALELGQRLGYRRYLDYGSGAGSGGILLATHGFDVTLADISTPLLDFARWRFDQRGLHAAFMDLKTETLQGPFDLITCYDVLEHLRDPLDTLAAIRALMHNHSVLIIRAPFGHDEKNPQHLDHDPHLRHRFRGCGFRYRRDLSTQAARGEVYVHVLQRVERPRVVTAFLDWYDYHLPKTGRTMLRRLAKRLRGVADTRA